MKMFSFAQKKAQKRAKRLETLAVQAVQEQLPRLEDLQRALLIIRAGCPDTLTQLLHLCQIVAPWHDRMKEWDWETREKAAELFPAFGALCLHFKNAGRDEYGMNRTRPGTVVTPDDIYLGGKFGAGTFPLSFWQEPEKNRIDKSTYTFILRDTEQYVQSHLDMVEVIAALKTQVNEYCS